MTEQFEEPRRLAYQNDKQMRELFEAVELEVEQGMSDWMGTPIQDATRNDLIYVLKSQ
jgi:hypothetical protein